MTIYKLIGIFGMLLITIGVLLKSERQADPFYIFGGILLEIYSLSIKDPIFVILQLIFISSATWEFFSRYKK